MPATYVSAIDELLEEEASEYDKYTRKCHASNREVKRQPPPILSDTLSTDDWAVITRYVEILKPLKDATMALEGHIGGRYGAIWRVLPQYEKILRHFEGLVNQYPINESLRQQHLPSGITFNTSDSVTADSLSALPDTSSTAEHHFSINIKLAWQKLDGYYDKLDDTPLYVAAIVLHPRMKWKWLERAWQERPEWIKRAKNSFNTLLIEYEHIQQHPEQTPP